jgi:pyruvate dehydrogenase E1 component alpha subunit
VLIDLRDDDPDIALARVLRDDGTADPATDPFLSDETLLRAYREMLKLRLLDARMTLLQRQGRIGFYGAAVGQEVVPIATALALFPDDWVFPALSDRGIMLVRGFPLRAFLAQVFGNAADILKGRQMPSHPSGRAVNQVSWSSSDGPQLSQAVGAAWAMRAKKSGTVAIAFCGDGATSQGDFHAAMNFAGVWRVPCVLVCQNNRWSTSVPTEKLAVSRTIAVKARAYGVPGARVDGSDLLAVYRVMSDAIERARSGAGPAFVEAVTSRMGPDSTSDEPAQYEAEAEVETWSGKDPIVRLRRHLAALGLVTPDGDVQMQKELLAEIVAAIDDVEQMRPPDRASLVEEVYAEPPWHLREQLEALQKRWPAPR